MILFRRASRIWRAMDRFINDDVLDKTRVRAALCALSVALVCHLGQLPWWFMVVSAFSVGVRFFKIPTKTLQHGLFVGMLIVVWFSLGGLKIEFAIAFLAWCAVMKSWELTTYRDAFILLNLCFFVVGSAFLLNKELYGALLAMVAVYAIVRALLLLHAKSVSAKHTLGFMAGGLPLFVLLFLFFPRIPPLWSLVSHEQATTGMSDSMSPGDLANLSQSTELAFRVQFNHKMPSRADLYWRGLVFTRFDGITWRADPMDSKIIGAAHSGTPWYKISLQPTNQRWLYALEDSYPITQSTLITTANTLSHHHAIETLTDYELAQQNNQDQAPSERHLSLPAGNPRTRELAAHWREQYGQDAHKITQAYADYMQNFRYTLNPPRLNQARVDDFLFNTRAGFCEHFSSSYVFVMRAVGIPARVVAGYQGGSPSADGRTWEVRQLDAHAWAEVWQNGQWVRVDPTAFVAPDRVRLGMANMDGAQFDGWARFSHGQLRLMQSLRRYADQASYYWQQNIVQYDQDKQQGLMNRLGLSQILAVLAILALVGGLMFLYLNQQKFAKHPLQRTLESLAKQTRSKQAHESWEAWISAMMQQYPHEEAWSDLLACYQRARFAPLDAQEQQALLQQIKIIVKNLKNALRVH